MNTILLIQSTKIKIKPFKNKYSLYKAVEKDKIYFKKQVEEGIKRLVGVKTKERTRGCIHCELWNEGEEFIKNIFEVIR